MGINIVKKALRAFKKYGVTLPYEYAKWKLGRKRFWLYAKELEDRKYANLELQQKTIDGLYDPEQLAGDCTRIMAGERRILFFEDPNTKFLDPKYQWEKDRMQHLYPLAILISKTGKQETIDYFKHEICCYANDDHCNNTNAMEIAIASINLLVSYQTAKLEDAKTNELIKQEIKKNLIYILQNIEKGLELSNNHYFFDLLGVLWITDEVEQDRLIQHLHEYAEKEMKKLLVQIISHDGSLYEGSTYYTRYVTEALCEYVYYHPSKANQYSALLQRMLSFLQGIACNGLIVGIGDNDSGRVLPIGQYFSYRSRSIQRIMELNQLLRINVKIQANVANYQDMGLLVLKREACIVYLRCDTISNRRRNRLLGGHEHNDQLSVQLTVGEEPIIVDPGTYLYISQNNCRINNMRTKSHSTFFIEGLEQNTITNDWNYKERDAVAKVNYIDEQKISATVCYKDVLHNRTVTVGNHHIEIIDQIQTNHNGALSFVMAPSLRLVSIEENKAIFFSENLEVAIEADARIMIRRSFYSEEYGMREETIKLEIGVKSSAHTNVTWKEKRKTSKCRREA